MSTSDPIANMLASLKNAIAAKMETVDIPHSSLKEQIVSLMKDEGYISKFEVATKVGRKVIKLVLKYRADKSNVIGELKRVSKPGRRVYVEKGLVRRVRSGFGTAILTTSKGVMTDSEARAKKLGGEIICYVW